MAYYFSPFRKNYINNNDNQKDICAFCDQENIEIQAIKNSLGEIVQNESYVWLVNYFPKYEGHTLIVPRQHLTSIAEETDAQTIDRKELMKIAFDGLQKLYPGSGVEVFLQYGPGSASSVPHIHWHLFPAMPDDELRGFEKLGHFYTTEEGKEKALIFPIEIKLAKESLQEALSKVI